MKKGDQRETVLVIDDDSDFRELLIAIGQICGVPVLAAGNCKKGLQLLTQHHTQIKSVILDYFMPGMDPSICAKAVCEKAGPQIPVILVTAAADPSARAAGLNIRRWISKPVDMSVLMNLLSEAAKAA